MFMMTTWKSGVHHVLHKLHVYIEARIRFLVSECLLPPCLTLLFSLPVTLSTEQRYISN